MPGTDPKQGEREYFAKVGPAEIQRALGKYLRSECEWDLGNITAIFHLLGNRPARVAELGCGVGWLSIMLARRGFDVLGVDISPDAIAAGAARCVEFGASPLSNGRLRSLSAEDSSFDAAIFFSSLHHAEDEAAAVRNAYRMLKPNGLLIAFEPGGGHGSTTSSQHAVANSGCTKGHAIAKIITLGRAAGFHPALKLPRPWDFLRTVTGLPTAPQSPRGRPARNLVWASAAHFAASFSNGRTNPLWCSGSKPGPGPFPTALHSQF